MYKTLLVASIILGALSANAHADSFRTSGKFGLGLGSGTGVNGLSGKYFLSDKLAVQANLGTLGGRGSDRFSNNGGIGVSADLLVENAPLTTVADLFDLAWNYGVGAGIGVRDDNTGIAAAGILGLELNFIPVPIDLVLEFRPTLAISPDVDFDPIDFTGHIRYYF